MTALTEAIRISPEVKDELEKRKNKLHPRATYDEVLRPLLHLSGGH